VSHDCGRIDIALIDDTYLAIGARTPLVVDVNSSDPP
jgi:hypothetical protein